MEDGGRVDPPMAASFCAHPMHPRSRTDLLLLHPPLYRSALPLCGTFLQICMLLLAIDNSENLFAMRWVAVLGWSATRTPTRRCTLLNSRNVYCCHGLGKAVEMLRCHILCGGTNPDRCINHKQRCVDEMYQDVPPKKHYEDYK